MISRPKNRASSRLAWFAGLLSLAVFIVPRSAPAVVTILVQEVGGDVVFSYGGPGQSLDLTGAVTLPPDPGFPTDGYVFPSKGYFQNNPLGISIQRYQAVTAPAFGPGFFFYGTSMGSALIVRPDELVLDPAYTSGSEFGVGSITVSGTLASRGISISPNPLPLLTLPSGDTVVMSVIPSVSVPEPSRALLLCLGAFALVARRHR